MNLSAIKDYLYIQLKFFDQRKLKLGSMKFDFWFGY